MIHFKYKVNITGVFSILLREKATEIKQHKKDYMVKRNSREMFISIAYVKVRFSLSKKNCFSHFNKSPLKMIKNAFYFILKALSVLKIFNFLS